MKPGQFAFILTEEEVILPFDMIGFISIRASTKFYGLVNVSGFHVDPGYQGKLIFAVFNAGPTNIHLRQGDRIFCLWLSELEQAIARSTHKLGYQSIPSEIVNKISGQFLSAYELKERIDKLEEDVSKLKVFALKVAAVGAVIGVGILFLARGAEISSWVAEMYSDIKEQFRTAVSPE